MEMGTEECLFPSPPWGEGGASAPDEGAIRRASHTLTPDSLRSSRPSPHGGEGTFIQGKRAPCVVRIVPRIAGCGKFEF